MSSTMSSAPPAQNGTAFAAHQHHAHVGAGVEVAPDRCNGRMAARVCHRHAAGRPEDQVRDAAIIDVDAEVIGVYGNGEHRSAIG